LVAFSTTSANENGTLPSSTEAPCCRVLVVRIVSPM
jgi:hypothetical protein